MARPGPGIHLDVQRTPEGRRVFVLSGIDTETGATRTMTLDPTPRQVLFLLRWLAPALWTNR